MHAGYLLSVATLLPLAGFVLLGLAGIRAQKVAPYIATFCVCCAFALSVMALVHWVGKSGFQRTHYVEAINVGWIPTFGQGHPTATTQPRGFQGFSFGVMVDSWNLVLCVAVSLIASAVHVFTIDYAANDRRGRRLFALLNLFCFSILAMVLSNNLLETFIFWQLAAVSAYLLPALHADRPAAARAAGKTFVFNRIGDAGFLVGMGLLLAHIDPAAFTFYNHFGAPVLAGAVQHAVHAASPAAMLHAPVNKLGISGTSWLTWAGLCFVAVAMARSAQFPLHAWLSDAMEGPAPVCALVPGVMMVASGVFLLARLYPILTLDVRLIIAAMGCVTIVVGALEALVATAIKRVLAGAAMSQIGFVWLFLGCGGYVAALFALLINLFALAVLFLAAGAVTHGLRDEHDLRRMGGLWRKMPVAAGAFAVGILAMTGAPYLSGFYSDRSGLVAAARYALALGDYGKLLFYVPAATMTLTAFYLWRCWWLVFGGRPREAELFDRAHESPMTTLPLIILAVLAVVVGHPFLDARKLIVASAPRVARLAPPGGLTAPIAHLFFPLRFGFAVGAVLAILVYGRGILVADRIRRFPGINWVYLWLKHRLFFDDLYDGAIVAPIMAAAAFCALFDRFILDPLLTAITWVARRLGAFAAVVDASAAAAAGSGRTPFTRAATGLARWSEHARVRTYMLGLIAAIAVAGCALVLIGELR